jgi:hypothetical protein
MLRNRSNIQKHREEICRVAGLTFSDDLLEDDYFIARFSPALRDRLDSLGLLNRGFCPLCGQEPVGTEYSRQTLGVSRFQELWQAKGLPELGKPPKTRQENSLFPD